MANNDVFLALRETLEEDMKRTGFNPDDDPPIKEPRIREHISDIETTALKNLYDDFLDFYEYISDQVAQDSAYTLNAKARMEMMQAHAMRRAHMNSELKNADMRKAAVTTDPQYISAQRDYIYFKTRSGMQSDRRARLSKSMDRLGRELWLRTQDQDRSNDFTRQPSPPEQSSPFRSGYKRVIPDE